MLSSAKLENQRNDTMTSARLYKYITERIENPKELAEFVSDLAEAFSTADEGLILCIALACPEDFWHSRAVQDALRSAKFGNKNLCSVFQLIACSTLTSEHQQTLAKLFDRENSYLFRTEVIFRLLSALHRRGVIDAKEVLLPKLRWYSSRGLWENAMLTLRVCAPATLKHGSVSRIAGIKSARCRFLLRLFSADSAAESPQARNTLGRAVAALSKLGDRMHQLVILDIVWICIFEGPKLACMIAREMIRYGDFRDCEFLTAFVADARDQETLSRLAVGPNLKAADLAKVHLEATIGKK